MAQHAAQHALRAEARVPIRRLARTPLSLSPYNNSAASTYMRLLRRAPAVPAAARGRLFNAPVAVAPHSTLRAVCATSTRGSYRSLEQLRATPAAAWAVRLQGTPRQTVQFGALARARAMAASDAAAVTAAELKFLTYNVW